MRKKSIVSFFLSFLLLLALMAPVCVSAKTSPSLTVSTATANPGDTVTLELSLSGNPGVCTMRLYLHYTQGLTLVEVQDTDLLHDSVFGRDFSENPYILSWDDSLAKTDNTANGVIAKLTFQVAKTAADGSYRVWITYDKGDIYNLELTDLSFESVEGTINVTAATMQPTEPNSSESGSEPTATQSESGSEPTAATTETDAKPTPNDPNSPNTGSPVAPTSENPIVPSSGEAQAASDNTLMIVLTAVLLAALLSALVVVLILHRKHKK